MEGEVSEMRAVENVYDATTVLTIFGIALLLMSVPWLVVKGTNWLSKWTGGRVGVSADEDK